jgi:hypothetical protein
VRVDMRRSRLENGIYFVAAAAPDFQ